MEDINPTTASVIQLTNPMSSATNGARRPPLGSMVSPYWLHVQKYDVLGEWGEEYLRNHYLKPPVQRGFPFLWSGPTAPSSAVLLGAPPDLFEKCFALRTATPKEKIRNILQQLDRLSLLD